MSDVARHRNLAPRPSLRRARGARATCRSSVAAGEIFALLGPNGGGKTTLFRLLSTLIPLQQGEVRHPGLRPARASTDAIRAQIGVVFQAPASTRSSPWPRTSSTKASSTASAAASLRTRADEMLARLGLADRRRDLRRNALRRAAAARRAGQGHAASPAAAAARRAEHRPRSRRAERSVALPASRFATRDGVTVVLTTHLLEEAEQADRIAIMHQASSWRSTRRPRCRRPSAATRSRFAPPIRRSWRPTSRERFQRPADGRRRRRAAGAARRPRMDRRGWSRRFPTASTDHARQADAGRRVHSCDRPPFWNERADAEDNDRERTQATIDDRATRSQRRLCHAWPVGVARSASASWCASSGSGTACSGRSGSRSSSGCCSARASARRRIGDSSRLDYAYFFPGTLVMILLFTAIFATISIIEDRREGFLQAVLVAPVPRWSMVLGKVLGGAAIAMLQGAVVSAAGLAHGQRTCMSTSAWRLSRPWC